MLLKLLAESQVQLIILLRRKRQFLRQIRLLITNNKSLTLCPLPTDQSISTSNIYLKCYSHAISKNFQKRREQFYKSMLLFLIKFYRIASFLFGNFLDPAGPEK